MNENIPFYNKPLNRAIFLIFLGFLLYTLLQFGLSPVVPENSSETALLRAQQDLFNRTLINNIPLDSFIFIVSMVIWLIFFAQFILPVKTRGQRQAIVERMVEYLSGFHGPAIFIENGIVRARESDSENKRRGLGVIWLDSASAAMLRTQVAFTRVVGPGVHFTKNHEYIAATVDLHTMTQSIGPKDSDQPFTIRKEDETYNEVQKRRWETSALTRDGIEVVAILSITFRIKANPNEGGTPFGFNPESTRLAITASLTKDSKLDAPVWSELPAKMAVDVWREYLRRFKLSQLFEESDDDETTILQMINAQIKERLSKPNVMALDEFGKPIIENKQPKLIPSREFQQLEEIGYQVYSVNIKKLIFAPEVEDKIINQWSSLWLKNAQKERQQVERKRKLKEMDGQKNALKQFATSSSVDLSQNNPRNKAHALEMLYRSTHRGIIRNNELLRKMNTEPSDLNDFANWMKDKAENQ